MKNTGLPGSGSAAGAQPASASLIACGRSLLSRQSGEIGLHSLVQPLVTHALVKALNRAVT
jgi:hypothetical protein